MGDKPIGERAIFEVARRMESPGVRTDYVKQACGGDGVLFDRMVALLRVHDDEPEFLEAMPPGLLDGQSPLVAPTFDPPHTERPGTMIGRYKLLQEIGEGGMGVVYMAEQREPVRRKVALKIVKPGMDTKEVVARFEAERQALAMMNHPNIAKVHDGGATESGRPYFVMELVHGTPLTEYCDQDKLTTRERLELFVQVCQAVQHAHQKGIIHRDIKPSNVMVTLHDHLAVPKIIDFGIAKATHRQLTEKTVFTGYGQMMGTPLYMSPEQAQMNGLDVDTRTDIYSLGVLLYELLTGRTPFDKERVREADFDEVRRIIRDEEPPRPSTRISTLAGEAVSTISTHRKTDPAKLCHSLRGELDWIVMKAMEKDRTRRYETANDLAKDVTRYLNDEPVEACQPSTPYRLRKFARRNRTIVVAGTAVVLAIIVGFGIATWQAVRATKAERLAKQQQGVAQKLHAEAESRETVLRRQLYAVDLKLAQEAWQNADLEWVLDRLDRHLPQPGQEDVRGFEWHYLRALCHQQLRTFAGHGGEVYYVAFSPDGQSLATAGEDGSVRLWGVADGSLKATLEGSAGEVNCIAFSPDGRLFATAGHEGLVELWETATGAHRATVRAHVEDALAVAFSPDGQLLASCGCDDMVRLWDAVSLQEKAVLRGHTEDVESLAFSPDGSTLATASRDGTVRLWDPATGKERATLSAHTDGVFCVAFSHDGRTLASADKDGMIKLWDAETGQETLSVMGHNEWIHCVTFSPDDRTLASASKDGTVRLWDTATGRAKNVIRGHIGRVWSAAFSPDGKVLATAGADRTVRLWDPSVRQDCRPGPTSTDYVVSAVFASNDEMLFFVPGETRLKLWNMETGRVRTVVEGDDYEYCCMALAPDGRTVATGRIDGSVTLWDTVTAQMIRDVGRHAARVGSVAFSLDGSTLASGDEEGTVRLWDLSDRRECRVLSAHDRVHTLAFTPDGRLLAAGCANGQITLWDPRSGHERASLSGHSGLVLEAVFSPDGKILATANGDGVINFWDPDTTELLTTLVGHAHNVTSLAFSPDGKTLASGSRDRTVKLWSVSTGQNLITLEANTGDVLGVAFTPDGKTLASVGESADGQGEIYRWSTSSSPSFNGKPKATVLSASRRRRCYRQAEGDGVIGKPKATVLRETKSSRPTEKSPVRP